MWGEGKLLVLLDWLCVSEPSWFSEQSWENVVIKFANLLGRPCSGSWLNLRAAGKRRAYNSSTDERRADLSTAEAKPHWFLPTCRIDSGITMKAGVQTGGSLSPPVSSSLLFFLAYLWTHLNANWPSPGFFFFFFFILPQKNMAVIRLGSNSKLHFQAFLTNTSDSCRHIFCHILILYYIKVLHQHALMLIHLTYCESWLIQLINM